MKRLILTALCLGLLGSLSACGSAPEATQPPISPTVEATAPDSTSPPTEGPTEAPAQDYALSDLVLVDNDSCSFTITGTEYNDHLGLQIHVLCENKSDRSLIFSWKDTSVCGFMYDPMWGQEVAAGKKLNATIGIDTYVLDLMKIPSVDEVTFTLYVQDSEDFMNVPVVDETLTIYPTGKTADTLTLPQYQHKEGETVIVENGDITFIIEGVDNELSDIYTLNCYVANHTDKSLLFSWDDVSVNGFMVNPYWSAAVAAGKQAYGEIIFYRSDLSEQDIEVVQEIEFNLLVSDSNDWSADFLLDEVYTFKP